MPQNARIDECRNDIPPFFDDIFDPFIHQSKNIEIRYHVQVNHQAKEVKNDIVISSVNECKTPEEFRVKLTTILESSLDNLFLSLQQTSSSSWAQIIQYIEYRLQGLTFIVSDESIIIPGMNGNTSHKTLFKSFSNCRLVATDQSDLSMAGQWIRFKSEKFAEVWLQVIGDAILRTYSIHTLLKRSLNNDSLPSPGVSTTIKDTKLKFNLSVPQLAYFLSLLVFSKIIDLPARIIINLLNWVVKYLQSKNQETIQLKSLQNKYSTPELTALDFWEEIIKSWLSKIQYDRERMTK